MEPGEFSTPTSTVTMLDRSTLRTPTLRTPTLRLGE
jgi:hypothetical protein